MNTEKLARTTFVLDRETHDRLNYVSRRLGVSRSVLVRDVLAEPVAMMERWVRATPEQPTAAEAETLLTGIQGDLIEFIERRAGEVGIGIQTGPAND